MSQINEHETAKSQSTFLESIWV